MAVLGFAVFYLDWQPLQYCLFCHKSPLDAGKKDRYSINILLPWDNSCLSSNASAVRYASCDLCLRWPVFASQVTWTGAMVGIPNYLEPRYSSLCDCTAKAVLLTKARDLCIKHCLLLPFERHYSVTHLRPSGHFMYHTVHILSTQCVYVLWSDHFAIQTYLTAVDNRHWMCLLRGTDLVFKHNSGYS